MLLTLLIASQLQLKTPLTPPPSITAVSLIAPKIQAATTQQAPTVTSERIYSNDYDYGNCTQFVASKLAIPDTWGNAIDWLANARQQGYITSTVPRINSVAWFPGSGWGHVALVTAIGPEGVTIEEMNVRGLAVIDSRTIAPQEALYIY